MCNDRLDDTKRKHTPSSLKVNSLIIQCVPDDFTNHLIPDIYVYGGWFWFPDESPQKRELDNDSEGKYF